MKTAITKILHCIIFTIPLLSASCTNVKQSSTEMAKIVPPKESDIAISPSVLDGKDSVEKNSVTFTIAVIPDTQGMIHGDKNQTQDHFRTQMQWLVSKKNHLNLKFVSHLGDLVENGAIISEWEAASSIMQELDDGEVPYSIALGNHDVDDLESPESWSGFIDWNDWSHFNTYFPKTRFSKHPWHGGSYPDNTYENNFQIFEGGGMQFLILHLRYNMGDDIYKWANRVLKKHSDKRAIIVTHDPYQELQNTLAKENGNVFMLLGGHHCSREKQATIANNLGGSYYQIMQDYQGDGPGSWCSDGEHLTPTANTRYYTFIPLENKIEAYTYSPLLHQFEEDESSRFTLDYQMTP